MLAAAAALPLSIRATWARHALRRAADHLVGLAAARGERGELGFERAGLAVGGEAGFLHRLGDGARLLLGARQIVEQHADIDLGGVGRGVERRGLLVELAVSLER